VCLADALLCCRCPPLYSNPLFLLYPSPSHFPRPRARDEWGRLLPPPPKSSLQHAPPGCVYLSIPRFPSYGQWGHVASVLVPGPSPYPPPSALPLRCCHASPNSQRLPHPTPRPHIPYQKALALFPFCASPLFGGSQMISTSVGPHRGHPPPHRVPCGFPPLFPPSRWFPGSRIPVHYTGEGADLASGDPSPPRVPLFSQYLSRGPVPLLQCFDVSLIGRIGRGHRPIFPPQTLREWNDLPFADEVPPQADCLT
jgi:hypothetical protein